MDRKVLIFGALAPSLKEQLGQFCPEEFQADADAITRLEVRGIVIPSGARAARKRLVRSIEADAKKKGLLK